MFLPVFLVLIVCVCFFMCHVVHRQTNRHSREISEIVPAQTSARMRSLTHPWAAVVTSVTLIRSRSAYPYTYTDAHVCMFVCLLFWVYLTAGWLALIRSRSSYNHTYQHAYLCVCVCMYLLFFCLFFFLSSWLPNSLFLLVTGILICGTTRCQPCHLTFLPGFHRFREWTCFPRLSPEILCLSERVDFLSLLDMYFPVFSVLLVCVCVCLCHGVHRQTNHSHTLELRWWRVWRWFALAPHTHIHTQTHKYACLLVCFSEYTWQLVG
jgi:hypothetical protein